MKAKATAILANLRESFQEDLDYARRRKAALNSAGVKAGAALLSVALNKASELGFLPTHSVYVYADTVSMNASIEIATSSLKSPLVEEFLSWIEDNIAPANRSQDYATEYVASRTFVYNHTNLSLEVCISLPIEGDACRRVKTGVKLVEKAVYALECA